MNRIGKYIRNNKKGVIQILILIAIILCLGSLVACREINQQKSEDTDNIDSSEGGNPLLTDSWEYGNKLPSEYTFEEFEQLTAEQQESFFEWFESPDAFEKWMISATTERVWENSGKQPTEYTWEEFEALTDVQQEAFFESFDSPEAFEEWMDAVRPKEEPAQSSEKMPWDDEENKPSDYSMAEFEELTDIQQEAFVEWFGSIEKFEEWYNRVNEE